MRRYLGFWLTLLVGVVAIAGDAMFWQFVHPFQAQDLNTAFSIISGALIGTVAGRVAALAWLNREYI